MDATQLENERRESSGGGCKLPAMGDNPRHALADEELGAAGGRRLVGGRWQATPPTIWCCLHCGAVRQRKSPPSTSVRRPFPPSSWPSLSACARLSPCAGLSYIFGRTGVHSPAHAHSANAHSTNAHSANGQHRTKTKGTSSSSLVPTLPTRPSRV